MKTTTLLATLLVTLATASFAGTPATYSGKSGKNPIAPMPPAPTCFGPGLSVGVFGAGFLPRNERDDYDNAFGGGALIEYFFTENIGLQLSYGLFATDSEQHVVNGDIIFRAPIHSVCIAPYIMVGGGVQADGTVLGEYHAGAGIEAKLTEKVNLFADGAYYWHKDDERDQDFTMVRLGLKFPL